MTIRWMPVGLALSVALLAGEAEAACREDLVAAGKRIEQTQAGVQKAATGAPTARCAAFRQHVAALTKVREVFARCDTGKNKVENVGKVAASIADFTKRAQESCKR